MAMPSDNILKYVPKKEGRLRLVVDCENIVTMGDRPIFGSAVTLDENLPKTIGKVIEAGSVIGWVNYIDVSNFACINNDQRYVCASNFLFTSQNELKLSKNIRLISLNEDMNTTKSLMTFSEV